MTDVEEALRTALAHQNAGRLTRAAALFEEVLACDPDNVRALGNLGLIALISRMPKTAVALIARSLQLDPGNAACHNNMGEALRRLDRPGKALFHFQKALALRPGFTEAHGNIGRVFLRLERPGEAAVHFRAALSLGAGNAETHVGMGTALADTGEIADAVRHLERAVEMAPDDAYAHCRLGMTLLAGGRFEDGWREYEWRLASYETLRPHLERLAALAPRWDGSPAAGRRVLLSVEQGLGDAIQFARYLPLAAVGGTEIFLHCPAKLHALLAGLDGLAGVVGEDQPFPDVDFQATLPSLPHLLSQRLGDTVPADIPYLSVDRELAAQWRRRLGSEAGRRIGIAWQGNPGYWREPHRSLPLSLFLPLAELPGVRLISLQGEHGLDQLAGQPPGKAIETLGEEVEKGPAGLLNTAAVMMGLDLVICVDTAAAHLAGALGRPFWVLLATPPCDWRWQWEREDSPWYPTARLFRQTTAGDWQGVMDRVAQALRG